MADIIAKKEPYTNLDGKSIQIGHCDSCIHNGVCKFSEKYNKLACNFYNSEYRDFINASYTCQLYTNATMTGINPVKNVDTGVQTDKAEDKSIGTTM